MIVINGPPSDKICERCGKPTSELKPFKIPPDIDKTIIFGSSVLPAMTEEIKLAKRVREEFEGYFSRSWECVDCINQEDQPLPYPKEEDCDNKSSN